MLVHYLWRRSQREAAFLRDDVRVLELGAGTGVCGLACAALGASVCLTDRPGHCELARANVRANALEARASVVEYAWGEALPAAALRPAPPYHLLLAADVGYDPAGHEPLERALLALCAAEAGGGGAVAVDGGGAAAECAAPPRAPTEVILAHEFRPDPATGAGGGSGSGSGGGGASGGGAASGGGGGDMSSVDRALLARLRRRFAVARVPDEDLDPDFCAPDIALFRLTLRQQ